MEITGSGKLNSGGNTLPFLGSMQRADCGKFRCIRDFAQILLAQKDMALGKVEILIFRLFFENYLAKPGCFGSIEITG